MKAASFASQKSPFPEGKKPPSRKLNALSAPGAAWAGTKEAYYTNAFHLIGKDISRFHCILWPALLLAAGVPRRHVVDDYALSESALLVDRLLAGLPPADRERVEAFSRSRPETIGAALAHLDERYGGARAYLRDPCGLSENELTAVRTRLVGANGGPSL